MSVSGNSSMEQFQEEAEARFRTRKRNVVLAGETGVGKSSLINLIVDRNLARVSNDSFGCTSDIQNYRAVIGRDYFEIWDTPGLDEGVGGTVASATARTKLRTFLRDISKTEGIHLLILCTRGWRISRTLQSNYKIIRQATPPDVPIAIVVTGLERHPCMNDWWIKNERELTRLNVTFDDHACLTTIPENDLPEAFQGRYLESQEIIHELILKNCLSGKPTMDEEIRRIRRETSNAPKGRNMGRKQQNTGTAPPPSRPQIEGCRVARLYPRSARHVVVCDSAIPPLENTTQIAGSISGMWHSSALVIRDRLYYFERVTYQQLVERRARTKCSSDLLIFYMDVKQSAEVQRLMLCRFYGLYGRNKHPLIIVIRGSEDHSSASAWWDDYIRTGKEDMETVHLACFPARAMGTEDRSCELLEDLIATVCEKRGNMGTGKKALNILSGVKEKRAKLRYRIGRRRGQQFGHAAGLTL
ncbi:hypothetical protein ID866_7401 [Astraeus odoratus]|nr:hypothetical protein ID866_7401 [Astraeus odoratus]